MDTGKVADSSGLAKGLPSAVGMEDTFCSSAASLGFMISRHTCFLVLLCIWSVAVSGVWQSELSFVEERWQGEVSRGAVGCRCLSSARGSVWGHMNPLGERLGRVGALLSLPGEPFVCGLRHPVPHRPPHDPAGSRGC